MAPLEAPSEALFTYSPLKNDRSIRLISHLSSTDGRVRCTLEEVELGQGPAYDCLSYTWDNPLYQKYMQHPRIYDENAKFDIYCNGCLFPIAENLKDALLELGKNNGRGSLQRQQKLWIDAVCINQKNEEEKGRQIGMMSLVYDKAKSVVVWLGPEMPDDPGLKEAMLVMERLSHIPPERLKTAVLSSLSHSDTYENLGIEFIRYQQWICFGAFILRRWFGRMWVLQETFFARNFIVFCGSNILPWSKISSAVRALKHSSLGTMLNERMEDTAIEKPSTRSEYIINHLSNQVRFEDYRTTALPLTLERLLADSRYFGAGEAQDRVFAVLNMWKPKWQRSNDEEKTADFLLKDSIPSGAYERASIVAIRETGDLNLLSLVEDRKWRIIPDLPSWVPDLSAPPVCRCGGEPFFYPVLFDSVPLRYYLLSRNSPVQVFANSPVTSGTPLAGMPRALGGANAWNAANGLTFEPPPEEDAHHRLRVKGIYIDSIIDFAETDLNLIDEHQLWSLLNILSQYLKSAKHSPTSTADLFEPFWKTLIKDCFLGSPAGPEARKAFPMIIIHFIRELTYELTLLQKSVDDPIFETNEEEDRLSSLSKILSETRRLVDELSGENSVIPSWDTIQQTIELQKERGGVLPEELQNDLVNIMESFDVAYRCRRLFLTKENRLGISAQSLDVGCEVWILAGAVVPVVLRRKEREEQKREFVGEAYVFGIMKGEAAVGQEVSIILE